MGKHEIEVHIGDTERVTDASIFRVGNTITLKYQTGDIVPAVGLDLETCIEMIDVGMDSAAAANKFKLASRFRIDPADYDGVESIATECVGYNGDTQGRRIWIVEAETHARVAEFAVPRGTPALMRGSDMPMPKTPTEYVLEFERTTSNQQLVAYAVRLLVRQRGATRTRVVIPLAAAYNDGHGYQLTPVNRFPVWRRNDSLYDPAPSGPWRLEVVGSGSGSVVLWNVTTERVVEASRIVVGSIPPALLSAEWKADPEWRDGDLYQMRTATGEVFVFAARLSFPLGPSLNRVYCLRRVSRYMPLANNHLFLPTHLDANRFSNPTGYFEAAIAAEAAGAEAALVYQGDATDAGRYGSGRLIGLPLAGRWVSSPVPGPFEHGTYSAALVGEGNAGVLGQACLGVMARTTAA